MKKENIEGLIDALKLINKYKTTKSFVADKGDLLNVYGSLKEKLEKTSEKLDPIYSKARQVFNDFDFDKIKKHVVYPDDFEDFKKSFEDFVKSTVSSDKKEEEEVKPEQENNKDEDKSLEPFLSEYKETEYSGTVTHYYELPGFKDNDLDASIRHNVLNITGTNKFNKSVYIKLDLSKNKLVNVEIQHGILSIEIEEYSVTKSVKINTRYDEI